MGVFALSVMVSWLSTTGVGIAQTAGADANGLTEEEAIRLANAHNPFLIPASGAGGRRFGFANRRACGIFVINPGILGTSIETNELSSKIMNGRAGIVQVFAGRRRYSLSIDPPRGFSAFPPGGNHSVVMSSSYYGRGDTNFSERDGTSRVRLRRGLTTVLTHLNAQRSDGSTFPAGQYSAELTVRCE